MRSVRGMKVVVVLVAAMVLVACSSSSSVRGAAISTSTPKRVAPSGDLRKTALAYAQAYLTGTALQQYEFQGPACRTGVKPTPQTIAAAAVFLRRQRAEMQRRYGMSTSTIQSRIAGVSVRNVGRTTGEAEVRYDLPVAITGNDNWVTYGLADGKWKVQDCHPPFGGNSSQASSTPATKP